MTNGHRFEWTGTDLVRYLRRGGWRDAMEDSGGRWVALDPPDGWGELGVTVPLDSLLPDYADALQLAIDRAARALGMTVEILVHNLLFANFDMIEASARAEVEGSVRAEVGLRLIRGTWDALVAAGLAESSSQRRAVYSGRRPAALSEYLSSVRLGFTRPGSYVVPFYSPWQDGAEDPARLPLDVDSFERRVLKRVLAASKVAVGAATEMVESGRLDSDDLVLNGVSANLFRALAELPGEVPTRLSIRWASSLEVADEPVTVPPGLTDSFVEAAERLSGSEPFGAVSIIGYVRDLHREHEADSGEIRIHAASGPYQGTYRVVLSGEEYLSAVDAHKTGVPVLCTGTLLQSGSGTRYLDPVTDFRTLLSSMFDLE